MLLILPISTIINYKSDYVSNGEQRIIEYVNGLSKLFSYDLSKFNIIISDNTTLKLDERITNIIPKNVKVCLHKNNSFGRKNKGCGLIEHWKYLESEIKKHKWVVHFEPRQILKNNMFINNFITNPSNRFCIKNNHIQTGLFCIESINLLKYINDVDLKHMVNRRISIEYDLYKWILDNNISYENEKNLNVYWIDTYKNTVVEN